jgi:hypothetical protein
VWQTLQHADVLTRVGPFSVGHFLCGIGHVTSAIQCRVRVHPGDGSPSAVEREVYADVSFRGISQASLGVISQA